jgi:hypothetical protein
MKDERAKRQPTNNNNNNSRNDKSGAAAKATTSLDDTKVNQESKSANLPPTTSTSATASPIITVRPPTEEEILSSMLRSGAVLELKTQLALRDAEIVRIKEETSLQIRNLMLRYDALQASISHAARLPSSSSTSKSASAPTLTMSMAPNNQATFNNEAEYKRNDNIGGNEDNGVLNQVDNDNGNNNNNNGTGTGMMNGNIAGVAAEWLTSILRDAHRREIVARDDAHSLRIRQLTSDWQQKYLSVIADADRAKEVAEANTRNSKRSSLETMTMTHPNNSKALSYPLLSICPFGARHITR